MTDNDIAQLEEAVLAGMQWSPFRSGVVNAQSAGAHLCTELMRLRKVLSEKGIDPNTI